MCNVIMVCLLVACLQLITAPQWSRDHEFVMDITSPSAYMEMFTFKLIVADRMTSQLNQMSSIYISKATSLFIEKTDIEALVHGDVREVFDLFDFWDGRDGLIGAEKVGNLLRCLGLNPTLSLIKKMGGTDKPGEKQFSFEEFLPIVKSVIKVEDTGTYAEFCEAFKSFDREGQGFITAGEMNYMLTAMGERLSDSETDAIMTDTDTQPDLDGNLKYEDFIKKVLAGHAKK